MKNQLLLILHYETVLASFERFAELCADAECFPNPAYAEEYIQGLVKQLKSVQLSNDEAYQRDQIFARFLEVVEWVKNSKGYDGMKPSEIVQQYASLSYPVPIRQKLDETIDRLPENQNLIYHFLRAQPGVSEPLGFSAFCKLFDGVLSQVKSVSKGGSLTASEIIETIAGDDDLLLQSMQSKQLLIEDILDFCASHFNLVAVNAANYRGEVLNIIKKHLMNNPQAKDLYKAYLSEELCEMFYTELNRTYPIVFDLQQFVQQAREKLRFATIPEESLVQAISEALNYLVETDTFRFS